MKRLSYIIPVFLLLFAAGFSVARFVAVAGFAPHAFAQSYSYGGDGSAGYQRCDSNGTKDCEFIVYLSDSSYQAYSLTDNVVFDHWEDIDDSNFNVDGCYYGASGAVRCTTLSGLQGKIWPSWFGCPQSGDGPEDSNCGSSYQDSADFPPDMSVFFASIHVRVDSLRTVNNFTLAGRKLQQVARTPQHSACVSNSCVKVDCPTNQPCNDTCTSDAECAVATPGQLYRCAGGGGCIACSASDGCVDGVNSWSAAVCQANVSTFCPGNPDNPTTPTNPSCNPPNSELVGGQCVPSCGAAGGNTCNNAGVCAGLPNLNSYDCSICCWAGSTPPQHYSCQNNSCTPDDNGPYGTSDCSGDCAGGTVHTPPPPPTHAACSSGACVTVGGGGPDTCSSRNDCSHSICTPDGACEMVYSAGSDQCSDVGDPDAVDCPQPPPTCSTGLVATSDRITPPTTQSTLSWTCRKAHNGCTIEPGDIGAGSSGAAGHSSSIVVSPNQTTAYTLTCNGRGGTASYQATVHVYHFDNGSLKEVNPQGVQ